MLEHLNTSDLTAVPNSNFGYLLVANQPGGHHLLLRNSAGDLTNILLREEELESLPLFNERLLGVGDYRFAGNAHQLTEFQLNLLSDVPISIGISELGWYPAAQLWFFSNAAIDTDGEVHPVNALGQVVIGEELYFLTYTASLKARSPKGMDFHQTRYVTTSLGLTDWADMVSRVHGRPGRIGVLFALATAFSDLVFERCGYFPVLFAHGGPASGKSSLLRALRALFGEREEHYLSDLPGFRRSFSYTRNTIRGVDEFRADDGALEQIKQIAERIPYQLLAKGDTKPLSTYPVQRTLMVLSHEPLLDAATSQRVIAIEMARPDTSPEGQQAYRELHEHVIAGYSELIGEVITHRDTVEREFSTHFDAHVNELMNRPGKPESWDDRMLKSYAMLEAIADCMALVSIDGHLVHDDLVYCLIEQQAALAMPAGQ